MSHFILDHYPFFLVVLIVGFLWARLLIAWLRWRYEVNQRAEQAWQGRYNWMRMPVGKVTWTMPCRCVDSIAQCPFHGPSGAELSSLLK